MAAIVMYRKNDQVLQLPNLRDGLTNTPRTTATVKATLYDARVSPREVVETCQDVVLSYIQPENLYRGRITEEFNPDRTGGGYVMVVTASDDGDDYYKEFKVEVRDNKG